MANQIRSVLAILSLVLLLSVPFFQQAMSTGTVKSWMTIARRGIKVQKMVAVKEHPKRMDEAVRHSTGDQTLREIDQGSNYGRRTMRQVEVDVTDSKIIGPRLSFTQRKAKPEFQYKREIPGGPNAQHHKEHGI